MNINPSGDLHVGPRKPDHVATSSSASSPFRLDQTETPASPIRLSPARARVSSAATSQLRGRPVAMAMAQAGMGLTKVVVLVGAGVAGSVVLRNGRLAEILGELQVHRVFWTRVAL